jgi:hypothetical protein
MTEIQSRSSLVTPTSWGICSSCRRRSESVAPSQEFSACPRSSLRAPSARAPSPLTPRLAYLANRGSTPTQHPGSSASSHDTARSIFSAAVTAGRLRRVFGAVSVAPGAVYPSTLCTGGAKWSMEVVSELTPPRATLTGPTRPYLWPYLNPTPCLQLRGTSTSGREPGSSRSEGGTLGTTPRPNPMWPHLGAGMSGA